jgi:tetratricopeptide (TPR) repeat protein
VYALAHIYSAIDQTKLLMIDKTRPLRVWVNGRLIENYLPGEYPTQPHYEMFHRIPVVLRAGRNVLLVKSPSPEFSLRIGDTPRDRALLLAEQRRFSEAALAFAAPSLTDQLGAAGVLPTSLVMVLAVEQADESYERTCTELVGRVEMQSVFSKHLVAYFCAQRPNAIFQKHSDRLIAYTDDFLTADSEFWALNYAALVNYRAGRIEQSLALLNRSTLSEHMLPLRALLAHQENDGPLSEKYLDDSVALATANVDAFERQDRSSFDTHLFWWWYDWATYLTLLREAEQAIKNESPRTTALKQRSERTMAQQWTASPETAAFDHAMLFGSRDGDGKVKFHQPYLARARRLAELGLFEAAESDFNKALELAPADAELAQEWARFQTSRRDAPAPSKAPPVEKERQAP